MRILAVVLVVAGARLFAVIATAPGKGPPRSAVVEKIARLKRHGTAAPPAHGQRLLGIGLLGTLPVLVQHTLRASGRAFQGHHERARIRSCKMSSLQEGSGGSRGTPPPLFSSPLDEGKKRRLPESVLSSLGLRERRAVVFFVQGKTSSERAKVLQVFADKAPQFAALACKLVAIWPRSKAAEAGSARRTSQSSDVAFCLTDESDILTTAFGFAKEDSADCSRARSACVVDASGSMIGAFPAVVQQIERTLRQLEPGQSFSIVLFREGEMLELPGRGGRLRPATPRAIDEAVGWMGDRTPRGRSDPSVALRRAFNLDPEVVYLVSTDITGAGAYEIDRDELFSLLDELNPADSNDRRRAIIRCIQLLEEDSLETLREIARRHGAVNDGSDNGFAFIDRKSLGLD